jgi:hypothetical protein
MWLSCRQENTSDNEMGISRLLLVALLLMSASNKELRITHDTTIAIRMRVDSLPI